MASTSSFRVTRLLSGVLLALLPLPSLADISHVFPHEFGYFQPQQQQQQQQPHPFHFAAPPTLYGAPPPAEGYPNPVTHAPVAPTTSAATTSTTTEFVLPEIIENRSLKFAQQQHHQHYQHHFIPLSNQYLPPSAAAPTPAPPSEERPNYESPGGYYYPRPTAPPTTTATTTTTTLSPIVVAEPPFVLPPLAAEPPNRPPAGYDYNAPPPSTPAPVYLPPNGAASLSDEDTLVEQLDPNTPPLRVRVKEMRCLQPGGGESAGYFHSVLKVDSFIGATPAVEDSDGDRRCEPKLARSYVVLDLAAADFGRCGVRACGKDLCVRLRFPALRGLRTGWDAILTLHCRTQERVAVKTHALKMGVANEAQARSLGTYARGGTQNHFRTHIELLRRSSNGGGAADGGYTRLSADGNAVQLGEELLLRAHVQPGDGWNYTKLSDVSLQRISAAGELLNSAQLITARGCLNPSMQSVCAQPPVHDPPLGQRLAIRAVMFGGMRSGEELVLSVRISGCLEQLDCQVATHDCSLTLPATGRRRRDAAATATAADGELEVHSGAPEVSEVSRISFRVIMPQQALSDGAARPTRTGEELQVFVPQRAWALIGSLGLVALLAGVGALLAWRCRQID